MEERLQKILAAAGYGSRRSCEELLEKGAVRVNGEVAKLGDKADPEKDEIRLHGRIIKTKQEFQYILFHKPRGVLSSTKNERGYRSVVDFVPDSVRLYPVGRLDLNSEGLILLTNDGELTNALTHPKFEHEKEYRVLLASNPSRKQLRAWSEGVALGEGVTSLPATVKYESAKGKGAWVRVTMHEGRKREIREIGQKLGLPVVRLIRVRMHNLELGNLAKGKWRELTPGELKELKKLKDQ
jgi:23S rRNA pseudouridine2605 synthase